MPVINQEPSTNPVNKFTFTQWLKHPTTVLLILMTGVVYTVGGIWVNSQLKEVNYLKARIDTLEKREAERVKEMQDYLRALMFKESQLKNQQAEIDNLKN